MAEKHDDEMPQKAEDPNMHGNLRQKFIGNSNTVSYGFRRLLICRLSGDLICERFHFSCEGRPMLANASNRAAITPLRFSAPPPYAVNGSRRRLALRSGWRLSGNLHTLGYFAAEVCLGTPQTSFELIVDTGSSLMALPCAGCTHCGQHKHGARFDAQRSSTASTYSCSRTPTGMHCHTCTSSECGYSVSYAEGSRISGKMVEDQVQIASERGRISLPVAFGCQTFESGLFNSQVADGIIGFSFGGVYGQTLHDRLVQQQHTHDTFSMCLSETVGALVLGATVPAAGLGVPWIPLTSSSAYQVR